MPGAATTRYCPTGRHRYDLNRRGRAVARQRPGTDRALVALRSIRTMKKSTYSTAARRGVTLAAVSLAAVALSATSANAAAPANTTASVWDSLAQCESSGNWGTNTGNGYAGG